MVKTMFPVDFPLKQPSEHSKHNSTFREEFPQCWRPGKSAVILHSLAKHGRWDWNKVQKTKRRDETWLKTTILDMDQLIFWPCSTLFNYIINQPWFCAMDAIGLEDFRPWSPPGAVRGRRALRGRARAAIVRGPAAAIATGLLRGHGKLGTAGGILGHKNCRGF